MFTFLDYDGVPWHNNYAEHAIKRFAKYRRLFDGLYTEESLNEYLILASVLTTCEFNNINRLEFLLSQEKSLEGLLAMGQGKHRKRAAKPRIQIGEFSEPQDARVTPASAITSDHLMIRVNCRDSSWKHRCKTFLKARQGFELSDFDADRDRDWANSLARRYGAKCQVRKRIGQALFTFAVR